MRQLTEKTPQRRGNARGGCDDIYVQEFEITADDIGHTKQHYLGHNHKSYTFTHRDVGKVIEVMSDDKGWTCWSGV